MTGRNKMSKGRQQTSGTGRRFLVAYRKHRSEELVMEERDENGIRQHFNSLQDAKDFITGADVGDRIKCHESVPIRTRMEEGMCENCARMVDIRITDAPRIIEVCIVRIR